MPDLGRFFNEIIQFLLVCFSANALTSLIPAFLIAGAVNVFIPPATIFKYFGAKTNQVLSYTVATISGIVISVWSCSVLPLFSGIRSRGAGLGPAISFLYSGPALDIPPLIFTFSLLGGQLGWGTLIGIPVLAVSIGIVMSRLFPEKRSETEPDIAMALPENTHIKSVPVQAVFFGLLLATMIWIASRNSIVSLTLNNIISLNLFGIITLDFFDLVSFLLFGVLFVFVLIKFSREDIIEWFKATWQFIRSIIPLLIVGALVAALVKVLLPATVVSDFVGGNGILACFISSVVGSLLYFCSLQQVPFIRALMDLGMGKGPALALELTGAAVSLPCMIVLVRVMGIKRTAAYIGLVVSLATIAAYVFGLIIG